MCISWSGVSVDNYMLRKVAGAKYRAEVWPFSSSRGYD